MFLRHLYDDEILRETLSSQQRRFILHSSSMLAVAMTTRNLFATTDSRKNPKKSSTRTLVATRTPTLTPTRPIPSLRQASYMCILRHSLLFPRRLLPAARDLEVQSDPMLTRFLITRHRCLQQQPRFWASRCQSWAPPLRCPALRKVLSTIEQERGRRCCRTQQLSKHLLPLPALPRPSEEHVEMRGDVGETIPATMSRIFSRYLAARYDRR